MLNFGLNYDPDQNQNIVNQFPGLDFVTSILVMILVIQKHFIYYSFSALRLRASLANC